MKRLLHIERHLINGRHYNISSPFLTDIEWGFYGQKVRRKRIAEL